MKNLHLTILGLMALVGSANAVQTTKTQVRFAAGKAVATYKSTLSGRQDHDYLVKLGAGQTLSVDLKSGDGSTYFNIISPKSNEGMFIGSLDGGKAKRMVPIEGSYTIRVYRYRATARKGSKSSFTLRVGVSGKAIAAKKGGNDKVVVGTSFHATAQVPCTVSLFKDLTSCEGGVIRRGPNSATLEFRPKGLVRRVLIVNGKVIAWDSHAAVTATKEGDEMTIRVGDEETYRVPDAFVYGG